MNIQNVLANEVSMSPINRRIAPTLATFLYPYRASTGPPKNDKSMPIPWFNVRTNVPWEAVTLVS